MMVESVNDHIDTSLQPEFLSDVAVQDGGAASFLGSYVALRQYLFYLMDLNYPMESIEVYRCHKGFKYGNSQKEISNYCLMLPIFAGHKRRHVLCYAVNGTCPILIGRPLLEKLGLTVDYSNRKYRWNGQPWKPVVLGRKNEYLIRLAENYNELVNEEPEVLVPDDHEEHIDFSAVMDIGHVLLKEESPKDASCLTAEDGVNDRDEIIECANSPFPTASPEADAEAPNETVEEIPSDGEAEDGNGDMHAEEPNRDETGIPTEFVYTLKDVSSVKRLRPSVLTKMIHTAEMEKNKLQKMMTKAGTLGNGVFNPRRKVWEVYVGRGRVTECLRKRGDVDTEIFSYQTGWDFDRAKDRTAFLRRLRQEEPDEVLITPACKLWSSLQELSASRSDERKKKLINLRKEDHDTHLVFTSVVYEAQRRAGRHATTEHPYLSRAWKTKAYTRMQGYDCYVDQCAYGLKLPGDHGEWHPAKKPTTFRTTKKSLYNGLWRQCPGCPYHVPIEGSAKGFGARSRMAEDYPPRLAKKLADLLAEEPTVIPSYRQKRLMPTVMQSW